MLWRFLIYCQEQTKLPNCSLKLRLIHCNSVRWQGQKGPWPQRNNMTEWFHMRFRVSFHPDSCYPLLFWPCCHPPTSLFSLHTFFGLSLSYFPFGSVWDSAILPKPFVSALLSGRLTKMFYWHCHTKLKKTKQSKAKQSKTQHLSLHWQHIKVTDWSLLKAINHHGCTPGKTPGWPWLTCTAMQLQKI